MAYFSIKKRERQREILEFESNRFLDTILYYLVIYIITQIYNLHIYLNYTDTLFAVYYASPSDVLSFI